MTFDNLETSYWALDIKKIERYYGAIFVGDFPIPTPFPNGDNYLDYPASIFWRPERLRTSQKSEYFGLINPSLNGQVTVFNGGYITGYIFNGLQLDEHIIYSSYRHDFRIFKHLEEGELNSPSIDGGFDYCKISMPDEFKETCKKVKLQVVGPNITILD